jgi:type I restriction enzyme R subunit
LPVLDHDLAVPVVGLDHDSTDGAVPGPQRRAAEEGLSENEYALFQMLFRESISAPDREKLKHASRSLLSSLRQLLEPMNDWTKNSTTQAEVRIAILDHLFQTLPRPPFTDAEAEFVASGVYDYVWERSRTGHRLGDVAA